MDRAIAEWDAIAGWAVPFTNGANDGPFTNLTGDHNNMRHNNILALLFHTELWDNYGMKNITSIKY